MDPGKHPQRYKKMIDRFAEKTGASSKDSKVNELIVSSHKESDKQLKQQRNKQMCGINK